MAVTSGVHPNRNNKDHPDIEQKKREQARQESAWAAGKRKTHPSFTRKGPDRQS